MALRRRLAFLLRRLLGPLLYPACPGTAVCRPYVEHNDHSVRDVCLLCGRRGSWNRVVGPF